MKRLTQLAAPLLASCLFAACVGPDINYGETVTFEIDDVEVGDYIIAAGDQLQVKFQYHQNLDIAMTVRPDGKISMPFAEEVQASGKTVAELDAELEKRVGENLKDGDLAVVVAGFTKQRIYVAGEVTRPGQFDLIEGMTAQRAIAAAGWIRITAAEDSVVVLRVLGKNKAQAFKIDLSEDALIANDVELKPYDIVYVPRSSIAKVGDWVDLYLERTVPSWVRSVIVATAIRQTNTALQ